MGRIEAQRADVAERADMPAVEGRAERVAAVLDQEEIVAVFAIAATRAASNGLPSVCATMIALVFGVIAASTAPDIDVVGRNVDVDEDRDHAPQHRSD